MLRQHFLIQFLFIDEKDVQLKDFSAKSLQTVQASIHIFYKDVQYERCRYLDLSELDRDTTIMFTIPLPVLVEWISAVVVLVEFSFLYLVFAFLFASFCMKFEPIDIPCK